MDIREMVHMALAEARDYYRDFQVIYGYSKEEAVELALELSSRRAALKAEHDVSYWQGYIRRAIEETIYKEV